MGAERVAGGGYTPAERWVVAFADGSSAFAKIGTTELTSGWLRMEAHWYGSLHGDFLPSIYGFDDEPDRPLLLMEDLSHGRWPPPWQPDDIDRLRSTLARAAATRPLPDDLPPLDNYREMLTSWPRVAEDPEPFLALGMCTAGWLEAALPTLIEAEAAARLDGDDLVHFDVRSDNVCLLDDRVVLVDWNGPARGPASFDVAFLAPSLRMEGGPLPEELLPDAGGYASMVAGFFARRAGLEPIPDAPRVRWIQQRQLRIALPWAARALGLSLPDLPWARPLGAALNADLEAGRITEGQWFERGEEILIDAYLASADPRLQSGKSGDEDDWRWSRELVLEAVDGPECHLLDVGCANGYLMESLHRWGDERGLRIEPYGLEISERMAFHARLRLPHWADRIWAGNSLDWTPPRRFDLVHTALDYAPPKRQRELVERTLRDLVVPGCRVVFRAERVGDASRDVPSQLRALGFQPDGVLESVHPSTGAIRRTAWLQGR